MARRAFAGILGAIVGLLPLVLVNVLVNGSGTFGAVETQAVQHAAMLGAGALLGGVLLGGLVAGWMGGRPGGAAGAAVAGGIAAILYAACLISLVVGARQGWEGAGSSLLAEHPVRASAAILLIASLLLLVALVVGWLAGIRRTQPLPTGRRDPRLPAQPNRYPSRPMGVAQWDDPRGRGWDRAPAPPRSSGGRPMGSPASRPASRHPH